jgi:hypothetical protein
MGPRSLPPNLVARDWRALARFCDRALGCSAAGPERDLGEAWLARGTPEGNIVELQRWSRR